MLMSLRQLVFGCVSDRSLEAQRTPKTQAKVRFGVPLSDVLECKQLPGPLVDMLVYIAQEGHVTTDIFRRPGNPTDIRIIMKRLSEGRKVNLREYNFYTLTSVIKKFLLKIPGGIFTPEVENQLLDVLRHKERSKQYKDLHRILMSLHQANQNLLSLLFGTWFRIIAHCEFNAMSSEAVAKSVAGSMFHTCATDPLKIDKAVQVLQILIDSFDMNNVFGSKNIQYFADQMKSFNDAKLRNNSESSAKDTFQDPEEPSAMSGNSFGLSSSPPSPASQGQQVQGHKKLTQMSSLSAPEVNQPEYSVEEPVVSQSMYAATSLSRFDYVVRKQMLRMKKRSSWFLMPSLDMSHGSGDMSQLGKTSCEALSSEVFMTNTGIDGGQSDMQCEYPQLSTSSSYLETMDRSAGATSTTANHHQHYGTNLTPDIVNGNHPSSSRGPSPIPSPSRSPLHVRGPIPYKTPNFISHSTPLHSKPNVSTNLLSVDRDSYTWYSSPTSSTS